MYYNSYEQEVYRYLKNYIDWGQYKASLEKEVKELETKLTIVPGPKGTRFGYNGGGSGGWHKDSEEETAALQREEDYTELEAKRKDLEVLADRLGRIDRSTWMKRPAGTGSTGSCCGGWPSRCAGPRQIRPTGAGSSSCCNKR